MAVGITFSETMAGAFAMGETDPLAGAAIGERDAKQLVLNARVSIEDMDGFIKDPEHVGTLGGTVDVVPLGQGLAATGGVFKLFSPSGEPDTKLMVYEMGFFADGEEWYLAGAKRVRNDHGFDLWSDTTTLLTTLHRGFTKQDPIAGAGVLSLDAKAFSALLSTLEVKGAGGPAEVTATIAKFGRFFMEELWDTYGVEALEMVNRIQRPG